VAFLFQSGLAYTSSIEGYLTQQQMGGINLRYLQFITSNLFTPPYGIWPSLAGKLYLYLPLLTMGLMSREISSGTIKLLYSSPIKVREIIFGKFMAMMVYNLVLILVLALIVVCGLFNIRSADAGLLFSGLFGLYLLLCAYAAIGLFMSCLTSYQVVAALSTLVLLAVLNYIGTVWQDKDFVRDLTYFLSISGRANHMLQGLINTKDILYFLVIIFVFLAFAIYKLQSDRESKPVWIKISRYTLITAGALALGYVTSRPGWIGYWDNTSTKTMTLTEGGQKILKETGNDPIEVTTYVNLLDNRFWYGRPDQRNEDMARWEPYLRFKPNIKFNYVYFYDSTGDKNLFKYNPGMNLKALAEKYAKSMKMDLAMFKTPEEIHKIIDLRPEQNRYVMHLQYRDRSTFLRLFDDQRVWPSEAETGAAIKRLLQAKLPKIVFLQGEGERSIGKAGDRHYDLLTEKITFRYALVNQGFDVGTVSLKDQDIPADIAALVIADPKVELDTVTLRKINAYIAKGGNLLISGEPGKQSLLNPLLRPLGIQLMDGMLVEQSKNFSPELIQTFLTPAAIDLSRQLKDDAEDSMPVTMRGSAALSYSKNGPFTITPLVMNNASSSWNKKIKPDQDQLETAEDNSSVANLPAGTIVTFIGDQPDEEKKKKPTGPALVYSPDQGDQKGPLPVAVSLTRNINGKQQRIVVSGDADFLSNSELARQNIRTSNFDFSTALFSWFSYGEFPIDGYRPPSADKRLTLTDSGLSFLKVLLLGILPGLVLLIGAVTLIRRKRK
jgi:ABC-2 type transport system permease protein